MSQSKSNKPESWAVQEVRYVEVALAELSTRQMHVEFDSGVRVVIASPEQIPLAAELIAFLRRKGGRA